jgi:hypothetical protein
VSFRKGAIVVKKSTGRMPRLIKKIAQHLVVRTWRCGIRRGLATAR